MGNCTRFSWTIVQVTIWHNKGRGPVSDREDVSCWLVEVCLSMALSCKAFLLSGKKYRGGNMQVRSGQQTSRRSNLPIIAGTFSHVKLCDEGRTVLRLGHPRRASCLCCSVWIDSHIYMFRLGLISRRHENQQKVWKYKYTI